MLRPSLTNSLSAIEIFIESPISKAGRMKPMRCRWLVGRQEQTQRGVVGGALSMSNFEDGSPIEADTLLGWLLCEGILDQRLSSPCDSDNRQGSLWGPGLGPRGCHAGSVSPRGKLGEMSVWVDDYESSELGLRGCG